MVFNSFNFWLVFPFIFMIYWTIPMRYNKARNIFLLVVSYLLYMNWKPSFAIILLGVTAITYGGAYLLDARKDSNGRKLVCWCFALLGLLPLLVFKYYNFLNDSLTSALESAGLHFALPGLNWAIPVGISFFTFQAVGYLLDVYHKRVPAEKNFLDYALFVSFFPQVTSGPISTAKDLMPQFKTPHVFNYEQGRDGLKMLLWGMFIKMVVADRIGIFVDAVYTDYAFFSGSSCMLASVLYTIQIYGDFSGYSYMSMGIAQLLGYRLINNFNRPYFASSITEFWKRWHISLTRWLTTHVYINLGGNRCSTYRQYLNIMITFFVSGLWHGANWTFVIWGVIHGFIQIIEKVLGLDPKGALSYSKLVVKLKPLRILFTFILVNYAWIFFRADSIDVAFKFIAKMTTEFGALQLGDLGFSGIALLAIGNCIFFINDFYKEYLSDKFHFNKLLVWLYWLMIAIMIISSGVLDSSQFIYVNF